jgi:hypothetical protein
MRSETVRVGVQHQTTKQSGGVGSTLVGGGGLVGVHGHDATQEKGRI